ncbi:beta-ketoacyl-[acyl-carrier-protein] synthase II [Treponema ruminis]|uniref:3-oxoacyl-[acyl-carrier-protein] synthase 2 n=1 Tax=Treponema ruminis TaxID=744515 RepID=A0A7W8G8W2_9SPIR|nr:beta-ketoacyl-ACP synthase II [Treponema ruminis]MBB5226027.1 3-oxoacyl-[acyl-carrier-protein] synthase II [Treponema ruminis]QSI03064.1 beta-ketoacyl-[acyl-carrier-protein] synthase II [Treponema ruminis]
MSRRRVVITGLGCVSPVGNSVEETWNSVKNGKCGVTNITLFDSSRLPVKVAAEVKDFDITKYGIDSKATRKMARFSKFCLAASAQAISDSGYTPEALKAEKMGVMVGNCLGGIEATEAGFNKFCDPSAGPDRLPPLTTPLMISNEAAANVNIYYGFQGLSWTINTACASGTDSLGLASDLIRSGRADVMLAGGTEAAITEFSIATFVKLQALASKFNDNPEKASRPFDRDRDGFVMAEGSAMFILEEYEHAKARGAKIYAEVAGFGSSCDGYHITAPLPDGSGAAKAVQLALEDAGLAPSEIQYYNAHGTSTHANDSGESAMLKLALGEENARKLHISSTKSMTGHLVGAAGAIEALFCVKAINEGFIPPTINIENQDVEGGCDLDYTPNKGIACDVKVAASASLGFGGHNGCIIIKKFEN